VRAGLRVGLPLRRGRPARGSSRAALRCLRQPARQADARLCLRRVLGVDPADHAAGM
jgi:hypothetical protein